MSYEPAFPKSDTVYSDDECFGNSEGMSLRDYFAAKAMQGLISEDYMATIALMVKDAYTIADAMMEARQC